MRPNRYVKESPRWLTTTKRLEETAEIMRHIAAKNMKQPPADLVEQLREASETKETSYGMPSLFVKPRTRVRTLLTLFVWSAWFCLEDWQRHLCRKQSLREDPTCCP